MERQRKIVSVNKTKFLVEVGNIIDTIRDLPLTYLHALREGKAEILRKMAEGAIIEYKDNQIITGEIIWLEPISCLMKPKILEYNKKGRTQKVRIRPLVLPQKDSNQNKSNIKNNKILRDIEFNVYSALKELFIYFFIIRDK